MLGLKLNHVSKRGHWRINEPVHQLTLHSTGLLRTGNSLRPKQDGRHSCRRHFNMHFLDENFRILNTISFKCVPYGPIDNQPSWVQIMFFSLNRQQTIIWTNNGIVYWRVYAPLRLNELTHSGLLMPSRCQRCLSRLVPRSAETPLVKGTVIFMWKIFVGWRHWLNVSRFQ